MEIYVLIPGFREESTSFVNIDMNIPTAYESRDIRDKLVRYTTTRQC
jgi:hypothetical protein